MATSANANYDEWGRTPLVNAVLKQDIVMVRRLLLDTDQVNLPDSSGTTPAIAAAHRGDVVILNILANAGADLTMRDEFGFDPLIRASMAGHFETTLYLLERGIAVDTQDKNEYTPLLWAAIRGHAAVVRLLLGRGADVDHQNIFGSTALMEASLRGNIKIINILINMGADVNYKNLRGMDALKLALYKQHPDTAKLLIQQGADVIAGDRKGFTALMWCAKWDYVEIARMLLETGADIQAETVDGHTALAEAHRCNSQEFLDFIEYKKTRDTLRLSKVTPQIPFTELLEMAASPMAVIDLKGKIKFTNHEMTSWFGMTSQEMVHQSFFDFISVHDTIGRKAISEIVARRKAKVGINVSHLKASGEEKQLRWVFSFLGEGNYALGIAEDTAEREKQESQHRQSLKMEAIGQLAGGIAHDFNNQLAGILGYSEVLLQGEVRPDQEKFIQSIITCARNASDLTQKLLAFSRKGQFRHEGVNLHSIIDEVTSILEHTIDKLITISVSCDAARHHTMGDATLLQSALLNLCLNSRDAMPEGGQLSIATDNVQIDDNFCIKHDYYMKKGEYIRISVTDTGCGMPPEVQRKIFEPFYTTKPQGAGTGMGLAAVYGTVKGHKGAINVYSEEGIGSSFRIYLPLLKSMQTPAKQMDPGILLLKPKKILIVDDETDVRSMIKAFLAHHGHMVFTCEDGREGLNFYQENWKNVDLVILDMVMPVLNGEETYAGMKLINPNIKAILISGYSRNRQVQKLLNLGINEFLQKPFNSNTLLKIIQDILE